MLVGAAKRLSTGKAVGVDIWSQQDQANNSAEGAYTNADLEGVTDKIEIKTADMREMPFENGIFDVVVSHWAVHNLETEVERKLAIDEIIRVLKSDGILLLSDIEYRDDYRKQLESLGFHKIEIRFNKIQDSILNAISFGSFRPFTLQATKR
jgi:ubiquinone/menaquinone biosynthesis C-methylase UbiE